MNYSNKQEKRLVKFPSRGDASFFEAVKAGVDYYFKSNRLSPYGNINMWIKAAVMMSLYLVPYALVIAGVWNDNILLFLGLWLLMGLACIFQPSHVVATSAFEMPEEAQGELRMKNSWAIHQVLNTADYAPRNRVVSWFIGGLNYQIEHHLFPGICHVHYRKIAAIVKNVTQRYGLPYHVHPTFFQALYAHGKMLKQLGRQ